MMMKNVRMHVKRLTICSLAFVALSSWAVAAGAPTKGTPVPGSKAPEFTLRLHNGDIVGLRAISLSQIVGKKAKNNTKLLVLSFFATWCKACKKELPYLQKLYEKYQKSGLSVVVISIDKEADEIKKAKQIVDQLGLTYPVATDRFNIVARRYFGENVQLPGMFLIDPEGLVIQAHNGYDEKIGKQLTKEVEKYLGL